MSKSKILLNKLTTLRRVWVYALLVGAYSGLAVWKEHSAHSETFDQPAEIHEVFSLVLGLLLVFRLNRAYERWWEARTLWGALINTCRNQAVKINSLVQPPPEDRSACRAIIIGFAYALRDHLRQGCELRTLPGFKDATATPQHVPAYLVSQLYDYFHKWKGQGRISDEELRILDLEATNLLQICGGCERIRNTLITYSSSVFIRQLIFLHLAALPWGLVERFGDMTILITTVAAYFMIGIEIIAHVIEEPFGIGNDDLDLQRYCETIDASVSEIFSR